ncbi:hypothetical protein SPHINGO8BC_51165 [Sphingobacterium multivorum]|uniref:Uncharacterized protein n=1 Tax=Sphingobacterium multivorum TaxID=28454 RepID=A0A654CTN2_SPHMU|nr:hypothetical protein SPHINGO8BC_51165 [Sphingobacterium multivorum]
MSCQQKQICLSSHTFVAIQQADDNKKQQEEMAYIFENNNPRTGSSHRSYRTIYDASTIRQKTLG